MKQEKPAQGQEPRAYSKRKWVIITTAAKNIVSESWHPDNEAVLPEVYSRLCLSARCRQGSAAPDKVGPGSSCKEFIFFGDQQLPETLKMSVQFFIPSAEEGGCM